MRTAFLVLPLLLAAQTAAADTWQLDPAHSRVGFSVTHLMVSSVEGEFPDSTATLDIEDGKPGTLEVSVTVNMESVDTRNDKRDAHLRTSEFFDVENHPTMTFQSRSTKKTRDGFAIQGDLTLRGVTKPVTLQATGLDRVVKDPWGNERMGASATATVNRQDFGVSWNQALEAGGVLVGDDVQIRIDAEFIKQ